MKRILTTIAFFFVVNATAQIGPSIPINLVDDEGRSINSVAVFVHMPDKILTYYPNENGNFEISLQLLQNADSVQYKGIGCKGSLEPHVVISTKKIVVRCSQDLAEVQISAIPSVHTIGTTKKMKFSKSVGFEECMLVAYHQPGLKGLHRLKSLSVRIDPDLTNSKEPKPFFVKCYSTTPQGDLLQDLLADSFLVKPIKHSGMYWLNIDLKDTEILLPSDGLYFGIQVPSWQFLKAGYASKKTYSEFKFYNTVEVGVSTCDNQQLHSFVYRPYLKKDGLESLGEHCFMITLTME